MSIILQEYSRSLTSQSSSPKEQNTRRKKSQKSVKPEIDEVWNEEELLKLYKACKWARESKSSPEKMWEVFFSREGFK